MTDIGLLPVVAGGMFGSILCILALFWKINRPWDIAYRIIFIFFGMFIFVSTIGYANQIATGNYLNQNTFAQIGIVNASTQLITYYNASTGDLWSAQTNDTGVTWVSHIVANNYLSNSNAVSLSQNNVLYSVWILWLLVGIFVLFTIIEIILWYRNMVAEAEGKRSGKYFMEGQEP